MRKADDEISGNSCFQLKFYSWDAYIISLHLAGGVVLLAGAARVDGIEEEVELVFMDRKVYPKVRIIPLYDIVADNVNVAGFAIPDDEFPSCIPRCKGVIRSEPLLGVEATARGAPRLPVD